MISKPPWTAVTWNVNSVKARLERLKAFLTRTQPDVVCLQELKGLEEIFPFETIRELGYHAAVWGQKTYNGVAILSRCEPKDVQKGFDDGGETAARFISATVDGVRVASAYIPNGQAVGTDKYAYKLEWFRRLTAHLKATATVKDRFLLMGDFNVAPEDRDVYDPEAWRGQILFSEPEKAALAHLCETVSLKDTFRKHHSETGLYSWWDYRMLGFPKNRGCRIDFVLASPKLYESCVEASIDRDERKGAQPSDHAPVISRFNLNGSD